MAQVACENTIAMKTVTLDEAERRLRDLVGRLEHEGELIIVDADHPVARLSRPSHRSSLRDLKPVSLGAVLRPFPSLDDDLLGEMLDRQ